MDLRLERVNTTYAPPLWIIACPAIFRAVRNSEWTNQPYKFYHEKNLMLLDIKNVFAKAKYLGIRFSDSLWCF